MGIKIRFLIDTGASKSVIDSKYAMDYFRSLPIKETDHFTTGLGANLPNSKFILLKRIRLNRMHIRRTEFAMLDLSIINDAYTAADMQPVIAIIGSDILKKYNAIIDFKSATLTFSSL